MDFHTNVRNISLFNWEFAPLMGMLGGGYYLHNISIPIARSAKNQDTVKKDVMLGYFFCFISYCICGTVGLLGFYGYSFKNHFLDAKPPTQMIAQDIFNMLDAGNGIAIFVRLCVFFHLFTIMSLIFANERALIFLLMYGKQEIESRKITYLLNFLLLIPGVLFGILYPQIAQLAGYMASISGFLCIYAMPSIVYLKQKHIEATDPARGRMLRNNEFKVLQIKEGSTFEAPTIIFPERTGDKLDSLDGGNSEKLKNDFNKLSILLGGLIFYGFLIILLQYIPIGKKIK
jgi:hypothetical protein